MKKIIVVVICVLVTNIIGAQDYRFGKVSKEELQEKFNPNDTSANATYLYKYRKSYFAFDDELKDFVIKTKVYERIKIYDKSALDFATKNVVLYNNANKKESIKEIKARTYNLIDGKVEDVKLKSNGIFETKTSKNVTQAKFTMPNANAGSIVEWEYEVTSPFYFNVDTFEFQKSIPIKKLDYIFKMPEYFIYKTNFKGYLNIQPTKSKERSSAIITSKSLPKAGGKVDKYEDEFEFELIIDKYSLDNIPALVEEPYVNNMDNYRASIKYEMASTRSPNGQMKHYAVSWEDVVASIYKSDAFGEQLKHTKYFAQDIDALLAGVTDESEKTIKIFDFVKSSMKWNGYYGKYVDEGVKKAYKNKTGNSAEINLMLIAILRYAGINANPILISTRDNGVPFFPTRDGYNYVACGVEVADNVILLDATSVYNPPNLLPKRALNWNGRIIRKHGSNALVSLYPKQKASASSTMNVTLDTNGKLTGMIRNYKTNHRALAYRENFATRNTENYLEYLEDRYNGMLISDFDLKNKTDLSKPIVETFKFELENQAESVGSDIYITPMFFLATQENPFKLEQREFPIDFVYPTNDKYIISIAIPEGYAVASTPKSISLALPEGIGSFKYNINVKGSIIQLIASYDINEPIIPSDYYVAIKEFFNTIIKKENEQVVLKKV